MGDFWGRWDDFPDYILGITKEIWEDRGVAKLNNYYDQDIVMRTPMGISKGNQAVIASTMSTIAEFPDRQLFGQDVIWSNHPQHGHLSSHRVYTRATQTSSGQFGGPTGKSFAIHVIADCAARDGVIYDEWLVRDYGGLVKQLGHNPRDFALDLIHQERNAGAIPPVFTPENDIDGGYHGHGNDNSWGINAAEYLNKIMASNFDVIHDCCDRAITGFFAGGHSAVGREEIVDFWIKLRSSFPDSQFEIHHQIGMEGNLMPPRAAIRWSLDGLHSGWGWFGAPTGAEVHVMGISHFEFGPWGLRREWTLFDEIAIWKQILTNGQ